MRIKETKVYPYSELSDDAKAKARDWYREACAGDNDFADFVIEDAEHMGAMLGITFLSHAVKLYGGRTRQEPNVYWSGFASQGDGASFEGDYEHAPDAVAKVTAETGGNDKELIRIASALELLQTAYEGKIRCTISQSGRYSHAMTMQFDFEGIEISHDDGDEPVIDDLPATAQDDVSELMRDFANWIYRHLESAWEYQNSDEQVAETIAANDYEFTADGKRA